jgi:uncharacterized protein
MSFRIEVDAMVRFSYTAPMKNPFVVKHLNVEAFAVAHAHIEQDETLGIFERLMQETQSLGSIGRVSYSAHGERKNADMSNEEIWLHLAASAVLPLTCQRCLGPVDQPVCVERSFRFVKNEALAAILDEDSEEDVLALSRDFDLLELVEDELIMGLPAVPKHEVCPEPVRMQVADAAFVDVPLEKPNPFAALAELKKSL